MSESIRGTNISKRFPGGVIANEDVSFSARPGEIHAVLGENGAGKTTLMKIFAGLYRPDSGEVEVSGHKQVFHSPRDAKTCGIGMVQQHFALIPSLTVAENLALVSRETPFVLKSKAWSKHLMEMSEQMGFRIRPDARVAQLSMGERQRVEIFRLLLEGAKILILDEPTSILAPQEAENLFEHLREFAASGSTILLVTHKIDHVKAIADRVTVLRRGRVVATKENHGLSESELAELMVGHALESSPKRQRQANDLSGETVLDVHDLHVEPIFSPHGLRQASFELRAGEILGVAGISGSGQDELVAALTGGVKYGGSVLLKKGCSRSRADGDVAYVPADRRATGLALGLSVNDNLNLRECDRDGASYGPFLQPTAMTASARDRIAQFQIRPSQPQTEAFRLSGGNQQKVVLARELGARPAVIVAENPTAGLDVATVQFVHEQISRKADEGAAVLLVSEDLDELLALCDSIMVVFDGRVVGIVEARSDNRNKIGLMMSGSQPERSLVPVCNAS